MTASNSGATRLVTTLLVVGVVAGEAQTRRTLNALTVPGEALPSECALKPPVVRPVASSRAEGITIRSVEWPPFPTNPWSGSDRELVTEVRKVIDGTPRLPDGPPLDRTDAAAFLLKLADNVLEAYRAAYVSADGSTVVVWAVRFNGDSLANPERRPGAMNPPRGFRSRLVRGDTVVLVTAPSSNDCVRAVDGYIRSLK